MKKNLVLLAGLFLLGGSTMSANTADRIETLSLESNKGAIRYKHEIRVHLFGKLILETSGCYTPEELEALLDDIVLRLGNLVEIEVSMAEEECSF